MRKKKPQASAMPPALDRFLAGLSAEPRAGRLAAMAVLLAAALYGSGLGYPLVYADFSVLAPGELASYLRALPRFGSRWLADASFGWSVALFGAAWPWQRAINLLLHALNVWVVFLLVRRLCAASMQPDAARLAGGWIAFFAAGLLALHPVAVYTVAYLAERASLCAGLFASIALWSTARAVQDGWRGACIVGPAACLGALACGPSAMALPLAMAWIASILARDASPAQRYAWLSVGLSALVAGAYALGYAWELPAGGGGAGQGGYLAAVADASGRFLAYLGLWLVPVIGWMAIELPEPLLPAALSLSPLASVVASMLALGALAVAVGVGLRRGGRARCAALAVGCALALYLAELFWPGMSKPFALARSYAWMGLACLVLACLVSWLATRAAFVAGCTLVIVWAVLAARTLDTFSTHVALWDDAVHRAERVGPSTEDARVYLNRAALHRRDGHLLAAIADYDKALELKPDQVRALRGRAQAYIDDKRYDAALQDLERLLALEPERALTHADRGLALMQAGRLAEAGHAFDQAIARGVKEPRVFLNRGLARLQMSGLEAAPAALADIERALESDPNYALAYFNRGLVFEEAAKAGLRLRDAASPEIMRAIAQENMLRACRLGHAPACARQKDKTARDAPPGAQEGPIRITPESLRNQGLPPLP